MRKLSKEKLDILQCHLEWVHFMGEKGKRADLRDADLCCEYRNDVPKLVEG